MSNAHAYQYEYAPKRKRHGIESVAFSFPATFGG